MFEKAYKRTEYSRQKHQSLTSSLLKQKPETSGMFRMQFHCVVLCIFAVCVIEAAELKKKPGHGRQAREFRPHFVKREEQAPIIHAENPDERVEEEYLVKLRDDLTDEELAAVEEKFQQLCEEKGFHVDFHDEIKKLMKGFTARIPGDAIEIIRWLDEVDFVEEDTKIHILNVPWGLDRIDQVRLPLDNAYNSSLGNGSGVNVFVADTGISYHHNEFEGRAKEFIDVFHDGQNGNDCEGHGTHCAGTIGGKTVGVAPGVTLYSCRLLNCAGGGTISGSIKVMEAIATSGIKPGVVSMSYGGSKSEMENLAVKKLVEAGYVAVAAAGNDRRDSANESPASAPEAIAVGATDSGDTFAWYSNYGGTVDILAPGSDVLSADYSDDNAFKELSGTSMATPHVSGVAALILGKEPTLTPTQVKEKLLAAATPGAIDMTRIPDNFRQETPNLLLRIPSSGEDTEPPSSLCTDTCVYSGDVDCDDGGPNSDYSYCDYGTDCTDCGPRPQI